MAFRQLQHFDPNNVGVDPRVDSRWITTSTHTVLAVSPYPTYNLLANSGGLNTLKLLGLIDASNVSENVNVAQIFEVGNKKSIIIPGKFRGSMTLSSSIIESINLLGSIYETVLPYIQKKGSFGKADLLNNILYRPELDKTYYSDPSIDPKEMSSIALTPLPDGNETKERIENNEGIFFNETASKGMSNDEITSKGALLFSLDDLRLKVKFGLCFLIFQSTERIKNSNIYMDEIRSVDYRNVVSEEFLNQEMDFAAPSVSYTLLGGQFYENCLITDYHRALNSAPIPPNISEGLTLVYTGTSKITLNPEIQTPLSIATTATPSVPTTN